MLYLIAYDIAAPRRLRRVAAICLDYGFRVEHSVFECELSADLFETMWLELQGVIRSDEDALLAYPLCKNCVGRIRSAGIVKRSVREPCFIL